MKKIISVIIFSILLLIISGCTIGYSVNKFLALKDKIEFLDYSKEAKIYYYDKKDISFELENNKFGKYDNDYFSDKSLIIITIMDDEKIEFSLLNIKNNKIAISRDNIGEEKLINWTFIIEVEGKISDSSNLCVSFIDGTSHTHSYIQNTIDPSCSNQGYTHYQCDCGYSYNDNYTDIIECKYVNGICVWCKNEDLSRKYNITIHSEDLVETTVGLFYDGSSQMEGCGYKNISSLYYRFEKNQLNEFKYIDMTSEFDDYYTCCYFNSNKKNLLDSIKNIELVEFENAYYKQPWGAWSGINFYLARFHLYNYLQGGMNHEKSLIKMDDIKWIEIPKNEIIPNEIDNYFLIAIAESKTVIETTIFGNETKEYKWYFESKHLYDDGLVYPEYDEFYNDWINQKYLVDYCIFATLICNNVLNSFSGLHLLKYDSLRIQEIDGINYIRTSYDNTLWGEQNLIDILEYKKEVVGIDDYDKVSLKIADRIRSNIQPSTEGLIEINTINIDDKFIIEIIVASGIEKPYYIKKLGMSTSGCTTRIGTQTISMTQHQIDKLYSMRVKHTLSTMLSPKQNLSFTQLKIYYQEKGYEEVNNEYFLENLEMYTEDRKYNYLAYLLSDNNNISIRVAKYHNDDFVERNDYGSCCLITAINRVLDKLNIENKTGIKITGDAKRKEKRLVEPTALREAVLNMFCHNDYSVGSEPYIIICDDKFELVTYGGLPQGLSIDEFFKARSLPRNRELMKIMNDLDMGEHIGRGMRRIMQYLKKEDFEISDNFVVINFNFDEEALAYLNANCTNDCANESLSLEENVYNLIKQNPKITIQEIADSVNKSKRTINNVINILKEKDLIERIGKTKGYWKILKEKFLI